MKLCVFCQCPLAYDYARQQWRVDEESPAVSKMLSTFVYECTYNQTMTKTHRPVGGRRD